MPDAAMSPDPEQPRRYPPVSHVRPSRAANS